MELCDKNVLELATLMRKKEISSREITESVFKRIEDREDKINAFITTSRKNAFKQADEADKRFKNKNNDIPFLNGIPVAIKDILCTREIRTTCGSKILENFIPTYNATAVEKIIDNGAVIVGKPIWMNSAWVLPRKTV